MEFFLRLRSIGMAIVFFSIRSELLFCGFYVPNGTTGSL